MVLNLEIFKKSCDLALFRKHVHQYFEMLLQAKLLDFKTFKDFIYAKLKTFGRH